MLHPVGAEEDRLREDSRRLKNWKRWGPYLSERQWGTVREDYSEEGASWAYFPHDQARSRAYRWGEDGLLGITDREGRMCFALALWNGRDPILKERLFGLTSLEGNHGEDVKEVYFYEDSTPTHSYLRSSYLYPQDEYPYSKLLNENRSRGKQHRELELADTGIFSEGRYFEVTAEYAKSSPDDICIRISVRNRAQLAADLHVLPTLWFRNTWTTGRSGEGYWPKPRLERAGPARIDAEHASLGRMSLFFARATDGSQPRLIFTDNETNTQKLFGSPNPHPFTKDSFHDFVIGGRIERVHPAGVGTKGAGHYRIRVEGGETVQLLARLCPTEGAPSPPFGAEFDRVLSLRRKEADEFYRAHLPRNASEEQAALMRQAYAGLLHSKQLYLYSVAEWLDGDPAFPKPPESRKRGRNATWRHVYNRDVISMPDKWEYPWYAAWDLAFHMIPFAHVDPDFAKQQLILMLREWYMHPNGQIPAYEFELSDVNPPVHAWAAFRVYKMTGARGERDRVFLARVFQKLLLNFTWWVNRKDDDGNNVFSGGFLGLDNIGVFDRSKPLPTGGNLEQADGTAWMAFYSATMLAIALELASHDPSYEDVASKFFEHFVAISDAMNTFGGSGLWDDRDGFYYDHLRLGDQLHPLRARSMVGLVPMFTVEVLDERVLEKLPGFKRRMRWFLENKPELARHLTYAERDEGEGPRGMHLLAIPSRERLSSLLRYMLDESEFLSPFGVRSLSRAHAKEPFVLRVAGTEHAVGYVPGESDSYLFGGNSNWRGPIWFPMNFLIIESLERYHYFYGESFRVECPTGSGEWMNLKEVARFLAARLAGIFERQASGARAWHGDDHLFKNDPGLAERQLFFEYFDGDTGRGLGASHQTGWTALVIRCVEKLLGG
ncbi:MAG: glucosidase [Deltaproteobacteria bacterium]|nr:glucosidase [Deltaproteobacteria bacterium]